MQMLTGKRILATLILIPAAISLVLLLLPSSALAVQAVNVAVSKVDTDNAVLVVKSDVASNVIVNYGGTPPLYTGLKTSLAQTRHEIVLDGLTPGATVHYTVTITNAINPLDIATVPDKAFFSARAPGESFTYGVVGDNRPGGNTPVQPAAFSSIISQMIGENLDLSLNVGDIIYGVPYESLAQNVAKYDGFFAATMPLTYTSPMYVAPGNHERLWDVNSQAAYEQELTFPENNGGDAAYAAEHYYSFDNGDTHFIALSTEIGGQEGYITGNQRAWLTADLAANTKPWVIVFMHRPLFSGAHGGDPWTNTGNAAGQQNKAEIHALFQLYGVDVVFAGHEHFYLHHEEDGIHYMITGGGGAPLSGTPALKPGDIFAYSGYEHMKVQESDSTLKLSGIDAAGNTIESFTLGTPALGLFGGNIYWASYADFREHELTAIFSVINYGEGDANSVTVQSLRANSGVEPLTATPLVLGDAASGGLVTAALKFHVPDGVSAFSVTAEGSCVDDMGDPYTFPGSGSL